MVFRATLVFVGLALGMVGCGGSGTSAAGDAGTVACEQARSNAGGRRYRLNEFRFIEPGVYTGCGGSSLTLLASNLMSAAMNTDATDDDDDLLDLTFMLFSFDEASATGRFGGTADCTALESCGPTTGDVAITWDLDPETCSIGDGAISESGECCFTGAIEGSLTATLFASGAEELSLSNVEILARFEDEDAVQQIPDGGVEPLSDVVNGHIRGFMPEEGAYTLFRDSSCEPSDVVMGPGDVPGFWVDWGFDATRVIDE